MDDPSHEEDLIGPAMIGEPDTLMFQPIRDLNADIEKLLEHLPSKILLLCPGGLELELCPNTIVNMIKLIQRNFV